VSGFGILLRKELAEAWLTRRLPVVAGLFLVIGMISPLTAKYLPEILQAALGDQLTIPVPTPDAAASIGQLQKNLGQLGALAAIALAMSSVSGELDRGTAALVLSQPATRSAFLAAKLVALAIVIGVSTVLAVIVAWAYTAVLFVMQPVVGWLVMALLLWLAMMVWVAITFCASTATGSSTAAAGIGFVGLIVLSIVAVVPAVDRFLPTALALPGTQLALGDAGSVDAARLATAIAGSLVLVVGSLAIAVFTFRRREL
jgi:ABC-2 type transport system permease protein